MFILINIIQMCNTLEWVIDSQIRQFNLSKQVYLMILNVCWLYAMQISSIGEVLRVQQQLQHLSLVNIELVFFDCADVKILYETPLRLFAPFPSHETIQFCDYLFPDESVSDSSERFREILALDITDEAIDAETEHMPSKFLLFALLH